MLELNKLYSIARLAAEASAENKFCKFQRQELIRLWQLSRHSNRHQVRKSVTSQFSLLDKQKEKIS